MRNFSEQREWLFMFVDLVVPLFWLLFAPYKVVFVCMCVSANGGCGDCELMVVQPSG